MDLPNDIPDQGTITETEDSIDYRGEILKNLNIIKILWKIDSNYPKIREALNTIVIEIIENNNVTSFMSLLDNGYKLDVLNEKRQSALHCAFLRNSDSIIEAYLSRQPFPNDSPDWADSNGLTHLHIVCHEGHKNVLEIVKIYLKNGSEVNACYHSDPTNKYTGSTPLHFAMTNENLDIIELLLENGADINAVNAKGTTPFHAACQLSSLVAEEKIELFINSFHADIGLRDDRGDTPLLSVFDGYYDNELVFDAELAKQKFEVLLRYGANILAKNNDGDTVLHLIIKTVGNCELPTYFHYTPLNGTEYAELVERVLKSNSELLDIKNNNGKTPLQLAVSMISIDIVEILLNHNANTSTLKIACENGKIFPCYTTEFPGFDIVHQIMSIIDLLANKEFEFSLEDHLMIFKFLIHEADGCDCFYGDLYRVIQSGTDKHGKQVRSNMWPQRLSAGNERDHGYLFLMKEANFYMDKELEEILISSPRTKTFVLNKTAKKELAILKSDIKLKNGMMLYDLMLQHPFEASRFLKNDNFDCKIIDGFVEFKPIILGFVTKAIVRNYIVKRSYGFVALTPLALLPALCFEIVLSYLSNLDIFSFCASALVPESNNMI